MTMTETKECVKTVGVRTLRLERWTWLSVHEAMSTKPKFSDNGFQFEFIKKNDLCWNDPMWRRKSKEMLSKCSKWNLTG